MNWHERYLHQAAWTRELRSYLFGRTGLRAARRVLEVGCGTGAVLGGLPFDGQPGADSERPAHPGLHGLDIDAGALTQCRPHAPTARLVRGNVLSLPYAAESFDITYCHFLLLWISDPLAALREMKRVTARSGHVLALAEPDYGARVDKPSELAWLGERQNEALRRQGAALRRGAELGDLFYRAGIRLMETGIIQRREDASLTPEAWQSEWQVLEADLAGSLPPREMKRMEELDRQSRLRGERVLDVPTYFAWGQV